MYMKRVIFSTVFVSLLLPVILYADGYKVPVVSIRASSSLPDNANEKNPRRIKRIRYCADKAFDNRTDTVWAEGVTGPGTGESITITLQHAIDIDAVEIMPGYFDPRYWKANNRIRRFELKTGDSTWKETFLCQDKRTAQRYQLSRRISAKEIIFTVLESYKGTKWDDTCLSELVFLSRAKSYELLCNRITYNNGRYDLSFGGESFTLFPLDNSEFPSASLTINRVGDVSGDLAPAHQVGMSIFTGSWELNPDGTIVVTCSHHDGMKRMGPEEEEDDSPPESFAQSSRVTLLLLGEMSSSLEERFGTSADFNSVELSRTTSDEGK
jgi:hypothetical protein